MKRLTDAELAHYIEGWRGNDSFVTAALAELAERRSLDAVGQRIYHTIGALTLLPNLDRSLWASLCNVHSQLSVLLGRNKKED